MRKFFVDSRGSAVFSCPNCHKSKSVSFSHIRIWGNSFKASGKCPCGCSSTLNLVLERRKHIRRGTNLSGTYAHFRQLSIIDTGMVSIHDLSLKGMKLTLRGKNSHLVSIGDLLKIEVILNDFQQSSVKKRLIIRNIKRPFVGTEHQQYDDIEYEL